MLKIIKLFILTLKISQTDNNKDVKVDNAKIYKITKNLSKSKNLHNIIFKIITHILVL